VADTLVSHAAVAAGNAVLCKTSDFTPECDALIDKLFRDAGFPEGLITILQGSGDVGQALIGAHPDKVFFTGSVLTGLTLRKPALMS
jgi:acyl-CoA reductase-like NAD-dependent aldehyde dehydrogenase